MTKGTNGGFEACCVSAAFSQSMFPVIVFLFFMSIPDSFVIDTQSLKTHYEA